MVYILQTLFISHMMTGHIHSMNIQHDIHTKYVTTIYVHKGYMYNTLHYTTVCNNIVEWENMCSSFPSNLLIYTIFYHMALIYYFKFIYHFSEYSSLKKCLKHQKFVQHKS